MFKSGFTRSLFIYQISNVIKNKIKGLRRIKIIEDLVETYRRQTHHFRRKFAAAVSRYKQEVDVERIAAAEKRLRKAGARKKHKL